MASAAPLNVLWISFEDTSPRFGCYGDPLARTPNVDRLAAEGCRFPNAFSTAGVCAPSRASIITGCYPNAIGAHHMRTTHRQHATPDMIPPYDCRVPHDVRCFTEYFRAAGYYCSNNCKTDYQFAAPFTAWDRNEHGAHWRERAAGQPFFAVFNPTKTHESGMWPERHAAPPETDPAQITLPPYLPDTEDIRIALARQYDNIADNDKLVGRLLQELEEDGVADNTIVVIWSDHGEGLPRAKRWPYDAGIRVPLIVRWPKQLQPGSVDDKLVSMLDLGPTMLSVCGLSVPAHMQGQPFLGNAAKERQYVHASRDRYDETYDYVRAVRDQRFKYMRNHRPELPRLGWIPYRNRHPAYREIWERYAAGTLDESQGWFAEECRPVEELYDLETDPWETTNLAARPEYAEDLQRLRQECQRWCDAIEDKGRLDEAVMVRSWYPDGQAPDTAPVVFIPLNRDRSGTEAFQDGEYLVMDGPGLLQLHCPTQGASIAWTKESGPDAKWQLYAGPIRLQPGLNQVRAKACRIGFGDSPIRQLNLSLR